MSEFTFVVHVRQLCAYLLSIKIKVAHKGNSVLGSSEWWEFF